MPAAPLFQFFPRRRMRIKAAPMEKMMIADRKKEALLLKATGIVRRIDELGRVVIPKEIRRTLRIREGDPSQMVLTPMEQFCLAMMDTADRFGAK